MTPEEFRQTYLLNICLATAAKSEVAIRESCDAAQREFQTAIAAERERAALEVDKENPDEDWLLNKIAAAIRSRKP